METLLAAGDMELEWSIVHPPNLRLVTGSVHKGRRLAQRLLTAALCLRLAETYKKPLIPLFPHSLEFSLPYHYTHSIGLIYQPHSLQFPFRSLQIPSNSSGFSV